LPRGRPEGRGHALIRQTAAGVEIDVRVIPRARTTACTGTRDNALVVRVAAPPVEGAANDALVAYLAQALHVPRRSIQIVSGERGRLKRVAIAGVTAEQIRAALG
jgi:uncharacterized protein (TIGR00251 family)